MQKADVKNVCFFKFGSSDWTRTSDIRINSPPFYRLNYRGIVSMGRILRGGRRGVNSKKHISIQLASFAAKRSRIKRARANFAQNAAADADDKTG